MKRYHEIHHWLRKTYGKANKCDNPECKCKSINFQWALKEGKEYTEDINNFLQLCRICHSLQDVTEHLREFQRNRMKGGTWTEEHKRKFRLTQMKPVAQLDIGGNIIQKFSSLTEASKNTGILISSISHVLLGHQKKSGGYKWKYLPKKNEN